MALRSYARVDAQGWDASLLLQGPTAPIPAAPWVHSVVGAALIKVNMGNRAVDVQRSGSLTAAAPPSSLGGAPDFVTPVTEVCRTNASKKSAWDRQLAATSA